MLRATPWSTGDGMRIGLEAGAGLSAGLDEFYGRNMPAPPARVGEEDFVRARAALRDARHGAQRSRRALHARHVVGDRRRAVDRPPARRARLVRGRRR